MSTPFYPQLAVGSISHYPVTREWSRQATANSLPGGARIVMVSPSPARVAWRLSYSGLSSAEWTSIQSLFDTVEGRLGTFTFLDPTDNLLSWTEDFSAAPWTVDPLLQIAGSMADPLGGSGAARLTNGAQTLQKCMQELEAPGDLEYCLSIYLRADTACSVNLIRAAGGQESRLAVGAGSEWTRVTSAGTLGGGQESVRFGIELSPGSSVVAFGPQVEAQPCAGCYKPKLARSGVFVNSRFDQDELVQVADAFGQYSTTVQITSRY